jgi:hypothetical protein
MLRQCSWMLLPMFWGLTGEFRPKKRLRRPRYMATYPPVRGLTASGPCYLRLMRLPQVTVLAASDYSAAFGFRPFRHTTVYESGSPRAGRRSGAATRSIQSAFSATSSGRTAGVPSATAAPTRGRGWRRRGRRRRRRTSPPSRPAPSPPSSSRGQPEPWRKSGGWRRRRRRRPEPAAPKPGFSRPGRWRTSTADVG